MPNSDDPQRAVDLRQRDLIDDAMRQVESVYQTTADGNLQQYSLDEQARLEEYLSPEKRRIHGYCIQQELHRGGQGVVYKAIQESTGKQVAIKVILGGRFAGPQQISRFEREVRILAQLKHPQVVTIHDSGVADGTVYYVMDYIDGSRLDDYFRQAQPSIAAGLQLMAEICDAVHAAHLHGVIHRDLKPGNILVDRQGRPHVLDFGLAKLVEDSDDGLPAMTQTGQFVGSLPWASPEQVSGKSGQVDLRTDVYSLGVIFYECLTDTFPYLVSGSISDVSQRIAHEDPINPRALNRRIDADLATLMLKPLEKDPERRYQSAGALAEDIRRYLAGDPIDARRSSLVYLVRKRIVRHKWLAGLATLCLLSILVGLIVSLSLWGVATRRAALAAANASRAEAVQNFLADTLASANISTGGKADVSLRSVIDESVRNLDEHPLSDAPDIESNLRLIIGRIYGSLGLNAEADRQLQLARKLAIQATGSEGPSSFEVSAELVGLLRQWGRMDDAQRLLADCLPKVRSQLGEEHVLYVQLLNAQAVLHRDRGEFQVAVDKSREAVRIAQRMEAPTEELAILTNDLALALSSNGRLEEAVKFQESALDLFQRSLGPRHFRTAICLCNLASLRETAGRSIESEKLYQDALEIFRVAGGTKNLQYASCLNSLGQVYAKRRDFEQSLKYHREALDIRRELLPANHIVLAGSLNNLAICYYQLGQWQEAASYIRQAMDIYVAQFGDEHPAVATFLNNLAGVERVQGHLNEAAELARRGLQLKLRHMPDNRVEIASAQVNLGYILDDLGEYDEAEALLRTALDARMQALGEHHVQVAVTREALASVLRHLGQLEEAERLGRQALSVRRELPAADSMEVAISLKVLSEILVDRGRADEALRMIDEATRIMQQALPAGHWQRAMLQLTRGKILTALSRFDEAASELAAADDILRAKFGSQDYRVLDAVRLREDLHAKWGKDVPAEP